MEFNLLCFLLWCSKFILLTQDLTMIKSHQGLWFSGHCKLSKFLRSRGEQEKVELQSLSDGGSFGRVSLQSRGNTHRALVLRGPGVSSHRQYVHTTALERVRTHLSSRILCTRGGGNQPSSWNYSVRAKMDPSQSSEPTLILKTGKRKPREIKSPRHLKWQKRNSHRGVGLPTLDLFR